MCNSLNRTVVKFLSRSLAVGAMALMMLAALGTPAQAATQVWDPGNLWGVQGGSGSWSTNDYFVDATGLSFNKWGNGNDAVFGGPAGTVTISGAVTARYLTFNTTGYILRGANTLTLGTTGTPTITTDYGVSTTIGNNTATVLAGTLGLTKVGGGTLTLNGTAVDTFTGGLTLNGGTLALDYTNFTSGYTDLIKNTNALTLGGAALTVRGKTGAIATSQTFASTTVNAGGGSVLVDPNNGTSTTGALNSLGTLSSWAAGSSLVVGKAVTANTGTVTITTTTDRDATGIYGGRVVFADGTAGTGYDWATSATTGTTNTLGAYGTAYGTYTAMTDTSVTDTVNVSSGSLSLTSGGGSNQTHNSLKLTDGATLALADNSLTLTSGGLLSTGTSASTISGTAGATRLTAGNGSGAYDLVVHQYNTGGLTISAVIGDNGSATSLTKVGTETLTLSGANTYTGPTYLNAGTLAIGTIATGSSGGDTLGNSSNAAGNLVFNGGTLQYTGATTAAGSTDRNFTINGGGAVFNITDGMSLNLTGAGQGTGGLTLATGTGTLTLSGANTYTGATTVNAGTLALANVDALKYSTLDTGPSGSQQVTFTVAGTNTYNIGGLKGANNLAIGANTISVGASNGFTTYSGSISGAGVLTKTGTGVLNLSSASNTFPGTYWAQNGVLTVASLTDNGGDGNIKLGSVGNTGAFVWTGGTLNLTNRRIELAGTTGGGTIWSNGTGGMTITSDLLVSGTGAKTLWLKGKNNGFVNTFAGKIADGAGSVVTVAVGPGSTGSYLNQPCPWVLSNQNTYTGGTYAYFNQLRFGSSSVVDEFGNIISGPIGTGRLYLGYMGSWNDYAIANADSMPRTIHNPISMKTRVDIDYGMTNAGKLTFAGPVTLTGNAPPNLFGGDVQFDGVISGGYNLTFGGTAGYTATLTKLNTYTGITTIGTINVSINSIKDYGVASALGQPTQANAAIAINGGKLIYTGGAQNTNRPIQLSGTTGGATIDQSGTGLLRFTDTSAIATGAGIKTLTLQGSTDGSGQIDGIIADNTSTNVTKLTKAGTGTWTLTAANTYSGATTVSAGTLILSNDLAVQNSALGTSDGGTITLSGLTTPTFGGLNGSTPLSSISGYTGNVTALTLNPQSGVSASYSGAIANGSGNMSLTKTGAGTQMLSGINTYTGGTTVSTGTLVAGSAASLPGYATSGKVTVSGGTLLAEGGVVGSGGAWTQSQFDSLMANVGSGNAGIDVTNGNFTYTPSGSVTLSTVTRGAGGTLYVNGSAGNQVILGTAPALTNSILKYAVVNDGTTISFANYATSGGSNQTMIPLALASHSTGTDMTAWNANTINARPSSTPASVGSGTFTLYSLTLDGGVNTGASTSGDMTFNMSGAVLQTGGSSTIQKGATNADPILAWGANDAIFIVLGTLKHELGNATATLTGTGGFTKSGSGTYSFDGVSSITGTYKINEGTFEIKRAAALPSAADVQLNGGTLRVANNTSSTFNGNLTVNADSSVVVGRTSAAATATTHTLGTLSIGAGRTLAVSSYNVDSDTDYGLVLGATTLTAGGGVFDVANNGAGIGTLTLAAVGDGGGGYGITKTGAGTLTLSTNNTYSGLTTVTAGTLHLNPAAGSALTATSAVQNNSVLQISAAGQNVGAITGTGITSVDASASLTANSIVQNTLTIGAGGSVTIRETTGAASASPVPEPGTWVLIGTALLGLLAWRRRR